MSVSNDEPSDAKVMKLGIEAGLFFGVMDCFTNNKYPVTSISSVVGRVGMFTIPCAGAGVAYVCTSKLLSEITGVRGYRNNFISGMAAGCVMGACLKSTAIGFNSGLFFGILACLYKESKASGWEFFPENDFPHGTGSPVRHFWDWSFVENPPPTWKKC